MTAASPAGLVVIREYLPDTARAAAALLLLLATPPPPPTPPADVAEDVQS